MKKVKFLFASIGVVVVMMSCNNSTQKPATVPTTDSTGNGKALAPTACDIIPANDFTPQQVSEYIFEFIKNDECRKFIDEHGSAGFIPLTDLKSSDFGLVNPYIGYAIYPCVEKRWFRDKLFFSVKRASVCPGEDQTIPIDSNDKFVEPTIWLGTMPDFDSAAAVLNYLKNDFDIKNPVMDANPVDPNSVTICNNNYKKYWSAESNLVNAGFGFIQSESFDRFLTRNSKSDIAGFTVFLGLNSRNQTDKIRIILVATDRDGKLLMEENSICLERSWPPIGS